MIFSCEQRTPETLHWGYGGARQSWPRVSTVFMFTSTQRRCHRSFGAGRAEFCRRRRTRWMALVAWQPEREQRNVAMDAFRMHIRAVLRSRSVCQSVVLAPLLVMNHSDDAHANDAHAKLTQLAASSCLCKYCSSTTRRVSSCVFQRVHLTPFHSIFVTPQWLCILRRDGRRQVLEYFPYFYILFYSFISSHRTAQGLCVLRRDDGQVLSMSSARCRSSILRYNVFILYNVVSSCCAGALPFATRRTMVTCLSTGSTRSAPTRQRMRCAASSWWRRASAPAPPTRTTRL